VTESETHGNELFVFFERLTPIEGRDEDVLSITRRSSKGLEAQPGVIQSMITRSEKKGREICSVSIWKSKSDFQAFMKSEVFAALLKSDDYKNITAWMTDYDSQMTEYVDGWHG
jgi:heme-degrading monooxygenase HmoA